MIVSNNRSGSRVTGVLLPDPGGCLIRAVQESPVPGAWRPPWHGLGRTGSAPAMLGDKLLTDMLAANRAGVLPLMVEPVGGAVTAWQKVLHALQAPFKAVCRRKMEKKS